MAKTATKSLFCEPCGALLCTWRFLKKATMAFFGQTAMERSYYFGGYKVQGVRHIALRRRRRWFRLPACLRIGVVKGAGGQFQAHAWVESDGVVVIGGSEPEPERYTPLPALDGAGS